MKNLKIITFVLLLMRALVFQRVLFIFLFSLFFIFISPTVFAETLPEERCAQEKARQAEHEKISAKKYDLAQTGFQCAEICLQKEKSAACYYFRGVNRGLILQSKTRHVKKNLSFMIQDFETAARLNPVYDHGAAYRALAETFLRLPKLPVIGGGYQRDLQKAGHYIDLALQADGDYFENLKLKGEVLYYLKEYARALAFFEQADFALGQSGLLKDQEQIYKEEIKSLIRKTKKKDQNWF